MRKVKKLEDRISSSHSYAHKLGQELGSVKFQIRNWIKSLDEQASAIAAGAALNATDQTVGYSFDAGALVDKISTAEDSQRISG